MAIYFNGTAANRIDQVVHPRFAANGGGTYYPFYVGCWVCPLSVAAAGTVWSFSNGANTGAAGHYFNLIITTSSTFQANRNAGSTLAATAGTITLGKWYFTFASFLSATVVRLAVYSLEGAISQGTSSATSIQPTGIDTLSLGARKHTTIIAPGTCYVAEFYYGLGNPIGTGIYGQSVNAPQIIKQLAHRGPFVIPGMSSSLLEYKSFYNGSRVFDCDRDLITGSNAYWSTPGTQYLAPHVPISPLYRRPPKAQRIIGF